MIGRYLSLVMAGLDPAIHDLLLVRKTWMPGHQGVYARLRGLWPGMTV
jgi:hypothetical protein